jgi:hypothetical protein
MVFICKSSDIMFPPEEDPMAMFAELFLEEFAAGNITQTEEPAVTEYNVT